MFVVNEWFPGALTETIAERETYQECQEMALTMARNFADSLGAKVDQRLVPGAEFVATVKQLPNVVVAQYTVEEV